MSENSILLEIFGMEDPRNNGYKLISVSKTDIFLRVPIKSISSSREYGGQHKLDIEFYELGGRLKDSSIVVSSEDGTVLMEYSDLSNESMTDGKTLRIYARNRKPL